MPKVVIFIETITTLGKIISNSFYLKASSAMVGVPLLKWDHRQRIHIRQAINCFITVQS